MKNRKMRNVIAVILAAVMVLGSTLVIMCCASTATIRGDLNGDGIVNVIDVNIIKRVLAGVVTLDSKVEKAADLNSDGSINSIDSNLLSRKIAGNTDPSEPSVPSEPDVGTDPTIVVESVKASAGADTVTVKVSVKNNPGILAMMLTCNYDSSALTLKSATNGDAMQALVMTKPGKLTSPCNFVWDGAELNAKDVKDGTVLTLTFEVADNAKKGTYNIGFSYKAGGIIDNDMQSVGVEIVNGSIVVS